MPPLISAELSAFDLETAVSITFTICFLRDNNAGMYDIFTQLQPSPVAVPPMPWLGESFRTPDGIAVKELKV